MFKMFGFGGVQCPRCGHRNGDASGYCNQCGLTLGAPRSEPVLRENRWIPANDELAVYFGVRQLSGIFTKTLRVPATTRAYILQGEQATEVPQGEYELEGFFYRLNNLLRDQHAEILITRTTPLPVEFSFSDLHTSEFLKVSARFTVGIKVENVPAFAQHFMTVPGAVTTLNLHELLAPSVRQIAAEFIGGRSMRDMSTNNTLREQLNERLQTALKQRLAEFGLAAVQVDTLALRHDKFDDNRERLGSLWLVADERHIQLEHVKQLDQLYDEEEWQAIWREEQKLRSDYRRAELRQDANVEKAELALQEAERIQGIRAREIDLYGRIIDSKTRKQAFERGAGAILTELEHELAKKKTQQAGEAAEWDHVRQLARIKMRTELEVAQQTVMEERALARQRFAHQLHMQQIQNRIQQALAIEDESYRRTQINLLRKAETDAKQREQDIEVEHHRARFQGVALANAARQREAERVQEWEEALFLSRKRELARSEEVKDAGSHVHVAEINAKLEELKRAGANAESVAQHEKLLRTIEADGMQQRQTVQIEEQRLALKLRDQEAQWQQALKKMEVEREERFNRWKIEYDSMVAQQNHASELARIDIERIEAIGRMSDTAKIALAATPNAEALAQLMRMQAQAQMSPEQLQALAGVVAAENSISPADALRMAQQQVQDERAYRDAQGDKDRLHQLDLLKQHTGSAVHHHHAATPAVPQPRRCANGHVVSADARFCPECGLPLQH
jgi:PBP1b-binding outer membrane lipoprotein LpoB